jgi:putative intracellular protease/amidase
MPFVTAQMFELKKNKKILCILTNTSSLRADQAQPLSGQQLDMNRTGFDVKAVAYIWAFLKQKHQYDIHFVTPAGGEAPMDPRSVKESESDPVVQQFMQDRNFMDQFKKTDKVSERHIKPQDYCAVFIPGSHGAMLDLPEHKELHRLIAKIYNEEDGCLATLGHGIAGLLNVPAEHPPSAAASMSVILKNKRVCCSTADEDKKLQVEKQLPYCLEEEIKKRGAKLINKGPFEINVVTEERLITAQNSQSAKEWIMTILREARLAA